MAHTDSPSPLTVAEERGVYAFGQASDMLQFGPNARLGSIIDDWDPYYIERVQAALLNLGKYRYMGWSCTWDGRLEVWRHGTI